MKIEFYRHSLGENEKDSVLRCLDGLFLTAGNYVSGLKPESRIAYPCIAPDSKSALLLWAIWVEQEKRDRIMHMMNLRGIGVAVNYRAIHLLSYFKHKFGFEIGGSTISLPFYPKLTVAELGYVIKSIREIVNS